MITHEEGFRWRGDAVSRLEAFSDTVFGFAVSLLVVSVEVPKSFDQLMSVIYAFPAFAVCFALLFNLWYHHYRFFRRYALQTSHTILITAFLLFFVLFYVYPLKFLFSLLLIHGAPDIGPEQARLLFVVYGLGYLAICTAMTLLYVHAWRLRELLQLTALEKMRTRHSIVIHAGLGAIGLLSALLAVTLPSHLVGLAGVFYLSISVFLWVAGSIMGKRERALLALELEAITESARSADQSI
jgi:uncharacterized membrane protein